MINGLINLASSLETFDLEKEQFKIVDDNKNVIADLQAKVLVEGKDITGTPRNDEYSDFTVRYKLKFGGSGPGKITDRVTFYMTGELYRSFVTEIMGKNFEVKSASVTMIKSGSSYLTKYDKMIERIGRDRYGLDPERLLEFFTDITRPQVRIILLQKTGLTF